MPYPSPHNFRHSHAVFALENAKDVSALKAVSQNLTHENLVITDGVYSIPFETDVSKQIQELGHKTASDETAEFEKLVSLTKTLLAKIDELRTPS